MYIQYNVMRFNTLFIIFTLDIKQCSMCMSLKNSLVETFSNNFVKLGNNSSSLNNINHKCYGACISDINRLSPYVCIVSKTDDRIQSYFQHLKFCQIFSTLSLKIVMTCLPFHL